MQPDPAAVDHLARAVAAAGRLPDGPRWTDPARWHLTLAFLGDVDESRVDRLARELAAAVGERAALRLRLRGAGTFPPRGAPRVLWTGVAGPEAGTEGVGAGVGVSNEAVDANLARLERTARAVARAARAAGVDVERRPFRPHLTLGRWRPTDRADRRVADALASYRGPPFRVDEVALVRSYLGPDPRHERLLAWRLRA